MIYRIASKALFILMLVSNISLADGFIDNFFISITLGDAGAIQQFLARGIDANVMDVNGNTALIIAARENQNAILLALYRSGAKLNTRNQFGESALMLAALNGHAQIVNTLLDLGADIGANHQGWTPMMYAAFSGHNEIVEKLLRAGSIVNAATSNGTTSLMLASKGGHVEVVKVLLKYHANVGIRNENGATAWSWAMESGNTNIASLLQGKR